MSFQSQLTALKSASTILIGFGLLSIISLFAPAEVVGRFLLDLVIWPLDGKQSLAALETRLLVAISGGLMAGWGVMLWLVTTHVFAKDPATGRKLILAGIITWYVVDSAGSVLAGVAVNVVVNLTFLALFAVPLLMRQTAGSPLPSHDTRST